MATIDNSQRLAAKIAGVSGLLAFPIVVIGNYALLSPLRLLGTASYLQVFEADRLQALARLQIAANFDDYYIGLPFFGLAATVCSYLWLKSGYIPKALAAFGLISSAWCVICAFVFL